MLPDLLYIFNIFCLYIRFSGYMIFWFFIIWIIRIEINCGFIKNNILLGNSLYFAANIQQRPKPNWLIIFHIFQNISSQSFSSLSLLHFPDIYHQYKYSLPSGWSNCSHLCSEWPNCFETVTTIFRYPREPWNSHLMACKNSVNFNWTISRGYSPKRYKNIIYRLTRIPEELI